MSYRLTRVMFLVIASFVLTNMTKVQAQTTTFVYQGRLNDGGTVANGNYDFQFTLWDALTGGTQQPQPSPMTVTKTSVAVANGIFTVSLDFGASTFPGANRYLEIGVRLAGAQGITILAPRQQITSTPYAVRSSNSSTADTLSSACNGCVTDTAIAAVAGSKVTGTIPVAGVPAGSGNYIQNTTSQQSASNFNISGDGVAGGTITGNVVNATAQYNWNGNRLLSVSGGSPPYQNSNTFAGIGAGISNTPFLTAGAGANNSFFGLNAGQANTTGGANSFFGTLAGGPNTTGSFNTLIGFFAQTGFIPNLNNATAIGANAQVTQSNSLVLGSISGVNNASASTNVGIGTTAPTERLHVVGNGLFTGNLTVAGTLNATVPAGSPNYIQNNPASAQSGNFNISGNGTIGSNLVTNGTVGIGTTNPPLPLTVMSSAPVGLIGAYAGPTGKGIVLNPNVTSGIVDIYSDTLGNAEPKLHLSTYSNRTGTGGITIDTSGNVGIGADASFAKLTVLNTNTTAVNASSGSGIGVTGNSGSNTGVEGSSTNGDGVVGSSTTGFAGRFLGKLYAGGPVGIGTTTPNYPLQVNGETRTDTLSVGQYVANNGGPTLCANTSNNRVALCGTSSLRYKANVYSFHGGFDIINRLRPISFTWKDGGMKDIGLGAEEVNEVEPLLTFRNNKGEIEGVKYNQLSAVFINAFKEQQAQIEKQEELLKQQQAEIKQQQEQAKQQRAALATQEQQLQAVKALVCRSHRRASVCK